MAQEDVKELAQQYLNKVSPALERLQTSNPAPLQAIERLIKNEPVSYRELFWDGTSINIFGERYPDNPVFETPIDEATAKTLIRRYTSFARSIVTAQQRLEAVEKAFSKKLSQRASALARNAKLTGKARRRFLNTLKVQDLEPFMGNGQYENQLEFGTRTKLVIKYKETFPLEGAVIDVTANQEKQIMVDVANMLISHSSALELATAGRVQSAWYDVDLVYKGEHYRYSVARYGTYSHVGKVEQPDSLTITLNYAIRLKEAVLDEALEALASMKLPVYRPNFFDYIDKLVSITDKLDIELDEEPVPF